MNAMIQAILDKESKDWMLYRFPAIHEYVYGHHITIAYKPDDDDPVISKYTEGQFVTMTAVGYAEDDRGQALLVEGIETNKKHPHITISCAEDTAPVYSNELLDKAEITKLEPTMVLSARIKIVSFDKKKKEKTDERAGKNKKEVQGIV